MHLGLLLRLEIDFDGLPTRSDDLLHIGICRNALSKWKSEIDTYFAGKRKGSIEFEGLNRSSHVIIPHRGQHNPNRSQP